MNRICSLFVATPLLYLICNLNTVAFAMNSDFRIKALSEYKLVATFSDLGLRKPLGITTFNDTILIVDSGNNRIVQIDSEGKLIKSFGKEGTGQCEFIHPTGITVNDEDNIFVIDSGNCRVQKFNCNGLFVKEYTIKDFKNSYRGSSNITEVQNEFGYISDIAVDSNIIYLSTLTYHHNLAHLYSLNMNDGSIHRSKDNIFGYLTKGSDSVYLSWGLDKAFVFYFLIEIKQNQYYYWNLPKDYSPKGLCFNDNSLYIISGELETVDEFDLHGNYLGTIFHGGSGMTYITSDYDGNIYISDYEKNSIFKLSRNI